MPDYPAFDDNRRRRAHFLPVEAIRPRRRSRECQHVAFRIRQHEPHRVAHSPSAAHAAARVLHLELRKRRQRRLQHAFRTVPAADQRVIFLKCVQQHDLGDRALPVRQLRHLRRHVQLRNDRHGQHAQHGHADQRDGDAHPESIHLRLNRGNGSG